MNEFAQNILSSRKKNISGLNPQDFSDESLIQEGGCGVVGFASSIPVSGRHIFEPSFQMRNRGNGKGGGIAAAGLVPEQLGVDAKTLRDDYILQIALLDSNAASDTEKFISKNLSIDHMEKLSHVDDHREVGLEVSPPDVIRYFVRVKDEKLNKFAEENNLALAPSRIVEDEFIYQNSFNFNTKFYAALGEKRAFVLSHARNLLIFKIVGYAEQVVQYYGLEDFKSNIWIAHQRYPTKGRVWHPAGAHPFIGMNEALVHNGDFANYYSISQYLRQHNIIPLFLTDTEVSVLLFDLWHRLWRYPIEYVIEALAPTMELDFANLPEEKKKIYRAIQATHMHASPDGPWFFIIARSNPDDDKLQLLGITDTSMLRPQVFALQEGDVSIGLICSEKQAIDATLHSLSSEDPRFRPVADRYWNARGGSHTDGGAFSFTIDNVGSENAKLSCADKFGKPITCPPGDWAVNFGSEPDTERTPTGLAEKIEASAKQNNINGLFTELSVRIAGWDFNSLRCLTSLLEEIAAKGPSQFNWAIEILSLLNDRRYNCGKMKRSVVLQIIRRAIDSIFKSVPSISNNSSAHARSIDWDSRAGIRAPQDKEDTLVVNAHGFPPEGEECDAKLLVRAYELGWKRFILYGLVGQRFTGCGFGPETTGVRIDVFGSSGDYIASGIDGMEIYIHDNAQDQLGQIMKTGRLVIYGDVGQAFMYGAKGGQVYVLGNAAGRPLINAVGRPRVVINGTCLDYLAESFMAGDPLNGGGFVIVNGIKFDHKGRVVPQQSPYPGSNLFSLASGGAIYIRDPHNKLVQGQLNGGYFTKLTENDWQLIRPYLETNEQLFGISIERDLLTVDSVRRTPEDVYRKVSPVKSAILAKESVPE
ncbi:MAG: GltB/FmdC/FwdC-like GXGXG domain-containing protein [Planctomycetota bacterium]|jgi:glutamate synthase domain-containing protein 1/glutamate synthase domain-containing protein 3